METLRRPPAPAIITIKPKWSISTTGRARLYNGLIGSVSATALVFGLITPRLESAGNVSAVATVSGAVGLRCELAGAVVCSPSVAGLMNASASLTGAVSGIATVTGTLSLDEPVAVALTGAIHAQATVAGDVTPALAMAGNVSGIAAVSGSVTTSLSLSGSVIAGATVAGLPSFVEPGALSLSGAVVAGATVTGTATETLGLSGAVSAGASVSGAATARLSLAGDVSGVATVSGAVSAKTALSGNISAGATVTGTASYKLALSGAANGGATVTGAASTAARLAGAVSALATVTAAPSLKASLSGSVSAGAVLSGTVTTESAAWTPADMATSPYVVFDADAATWSGSNFASLSNPGSTGGSFSAVDGTVTEGATLNGYKTALFNGASSLHANNSDVTTLGTSGAVFIFIVLAHADASPTNWGGPLGWGWDQDAGGWAFFTQINASSGYYGTDLVAGHIQNAWDQGGGYTNGLTVDGLAPTNTNWHILDAQIGDASSKLALDGASILSASNYNTTYRKMSGGTWVGHIGYDSGYFKGRIAYAYIGPPPSDSDRQKLQGWAAWKYNLVSNLASGHPYKTAAPTV